MFTPGTLITTERGQSPIEDLRRGEKIVTRDHGLKRVAWIGRRDFSYHDLNAAENLRPILIKAGALGAGRPERDMLVSPTHRFIVRGNDTALKSALSLRDYRRIKPAPTLGVSYLHIMCNAHEVILANGAWSECFHPDDAIMKETAAPQRQEVLLLFPEVATMGAATRAKRARDVRKDRSRFET
ncbi:MAG: Hint domain-containing protein [Silicimonas sp.]|nr:Hint domain-containing protein [Silicimonas sp.]